VGKPRYSADEVATALLEAQGLRSIAAERLGCSRETVDQYVDATHGKPEGDELDSSAAKATNVSD
jgi:hypothetical protein